jgi:gliding motility-associated-like protein
MANTSISMSIVRQIIKLYSKGIGKKKIAFRLGISKNTVKSYIEYFSKLNTTWEDLIKLDDFELNKLFHPDPAIPQSDRLRKLHEYFPIVDRKMRQRGMTRAKLWKEYLAKHPDGYKDSQFNYYYQLWRKRIYPSMHIEHKAGDMVYVDFAGETLPYVDAATGEIKKAQVFVAILGASQYSFLPNIFSPNSDGNNDIFRVRGENISEIYLVIYNRWGEKIFETTDKTKGWDGTFNGTPQQPGVFVYFLNVSYDDGKTKELKGNVTLIR